MRAHGIDLYWILFFVNMEKSRIAQYLPYVSQIEEPIRQIVPALWGLPFVKDTGFSCSGHVLSQPEQATGRGRVGRYGWHLHRAMLEFAFSNDETFLAERDAFRAELKQVSASEGDLVLRFNNVHSCENLYRPYSRETEPNLGENLNACLMERLPEDPALIEPVEALLSSFWEEVAMVVRRYNPRAEIGPIRGKNFRKVTNWVSFGNLIQSRSSSSGGFF